MRSAASSSLYGAQASVAFSSATPWRSGATSSQSSSCRVMNLLRDKIHGSPTMERVKHVEEKKSSNDK